MKAMKRFYKQVSYTLDEGGYSLCLDDKPVKTPLQNMLVVKSERLAQDMVIEWQDQAETVKPETMPLTSLATTCADKIQGNEQNVFEQIEPFIHGDTILYWAPDDVLRKQQEQKWAPVLTWVQERFENDWVVQEGFSPDDQSQSTVEAIRSWVLSLSAENLTTYQTLVSITSSPILSCAFMEKEITVKDLFDLAFLEELYQIEQWGLDQEAEKRHTSIQQELKDIERYWQLSL